MWPPTSASARGIWWSPRPDEGGGHAHWSRKKRRRWTRWKRPPRTGRSGPSSGSGKNGNGLRGRARALRLPPLQHRPAPPPGSPLLPDRLPQLRFADDPAVQRPRRQRITRTGRCSLSKTSRRPGRLHRVPGVRHCLSRSGHRDAGRQSLYSFRPMHQLPGLYPGLSGKRHKIAEMRTR
jgi:hypothetical protein